MITAQQNGDSLCTAHAAGQVRTLSYNGTQPTTHVPTVSVPALHVPVPATFYAQTYLSVLRFITLEPSQQTVRQDDAIHSGRLLHNLTSSAVLLSCQQPPHRLRDKPEENIRHSNWQTSSVPTWHERAFLFFKPSRPSLGPTQPPVQCVPETFLRGIQRPKNQANHSPNLLPRLWINGALHPLRHMPSVVCTWTT